MYADKRVLVVIPARGGSTGVKLKNLREVGGVPLVARAAIVARELGFADRIIVSTDHSKIAEVARSFGVDVPFLRPDDLSGPSVGDWEVLHHALTEMERLDSVTYDIIIMLQPTSPSRTAKHVRDTVAQLADNGFDAVWTVSETDSKGHPLKQFLVTENGELQYYDQRGAAIVARQQLSPVYHRNGIAYAMTRSCLLDQKSIKGVRTGALIVLGDVVNIDTEFDLQLANFIFSRGLGSDGGTKQ
jgi:CMP-N,N'-diacetyllegionaminic acid synthase